ncbi:segregation and condensation protein A [Limisalsivibrio acetivorans]|uniref:segregation and condensation protein A n=1 Tax=Limisalsivibrio acetivorans TaxID=1304888 RepID=UPI0003B5BBEF|nr:segregation/condensation protein A [Limisalsivibrio acetivorans]
MSQLLDVSLDNFEGPLDLLIHLIYKNELDIYDIPIAFITESFITVINEMEKLDIEVAAEFINMASYLIYLKSRMLLPRDSFFDEDMDPEEEKYLFTQRLVEYSFYKDVSDLIREKEQEAGKSLMRSDSIYIPKEAQEPEDPFRLACAFFEVLNKETEPNMVVERSLISFEDTVEKIRTLVFSKYRFFWTDILENCHSRQEVAVSLLAVLELVKMRVAVAIQQENFGDILIEKGVEEDGEG